MVMLVKLLGVFIIVFGLTYLYNPNIMKNYIEFWKAKKRIYIGAVLSLLISVILLLAASRCRVSWFIILFGLLGLIKGVVLFAVKQEKVASWLEWWTGRPVIFLRLHAVIAVIMGILLLYSA